MAWFDRVLEIVAWLVVLVATGSMLASIYNSMNERRRELAILRALGARRLTLSARWSWKRPRSRRWGGRGYAVYAAILAGVASVVRAQTGVVLEVLRWDASAGARAALILALGALAGLIPALKAYRTDVAENLTPHS